MLYFLNSNTVEYRLSGLIIAASLCPNTEIVKIIETIIEGVKLEVHMWGKIITHDINNIHF